MKADGVGNHAGGHEFYNKSIDDSLITEVKADGVGDHAGGRAGRLLLQAAAVSGVDRCVAVGGAVGSVDIHSIPGQVGQRPCAPHSRPVTEERLAGHAGNGGIAWKHTHNTHLSNLPTLGTASQHTNTCMLELQSCTEMLL